MTMKCKVGFQSKIEPVQGSVVVDASGVSTGTCPACLTPGVVLALVGGFIRNHTVSDAALPENNPQPATLTEAPVRHGKFFSEPVLDVADSGSRMGDPRAAAQRRTADIQGAHRQGTVKVPVKGDKGRAKLTEVPATEENVRKALDHARTRKPRSEAGRLRQNDMVSSLVRRLEAMRKATVVQHAPVDAPVTSVVATVREAKPTAMGAKESPEGLTSRQTGRRVASMLDGPALVQGPNMAPQQRRWKNPATGESEVAAAYLDGALTERLDRTVADERPKAHWSASQRSNYRKKQRRQAMGDLVKRQSGK